LIFKASSFIPLSGTLVDRLSILADLAQPYSNTKISAENLNFIKSSSNIQNQNYLFPLEKNALSMQIKQPNISYSKKS
jgi:hypothetical protein